MVCYGYIMFYHWQDAIQTWGWTLDVVNQYIGHPRSLWHRLNSLHQEWYSKDMCQQEAIQQALINTTSNPWISLAHVTTSIDHRTVDWFGKTLEVSCASFESWLSRKNHSRYFSNVFTNLHQSSPFFETSSSTWSNQNSVHRTNSTTVAMASRSARRLLPLALLALYGPAQVPQPLAPRQPKVGEVLLGPRRLQDGMETWRWETLGVGSWVV